MSEKFLAISIESNVINTKEGIEFSLSGIFTQLQYPPAPFSFEIIKRIDDISIVSDTGNWLILEPSISLSPSFLIKTAFCPRTAVFEYYLKSNTPGFPKPIIKGTAIHNVYQRVLQQGNLPSSNEMTLLISEALLEYKDFFAAPEMPSDKDLISMIRSEISEPFLEKLLCMTDKLISVEECVDNHGIRGYIDVVADGNYLDASGKTFLELKSGKESPDHAVQLAAYALATWSEKNNYCVVYTKTGTIKNVRVESGAMLDVVYLRHSILHKLLTGTLPECTKNWCSKNSPAEQAYALYPDIMTRLYRSISQKLCGKRFHIDSYTMNSNTVLISRVNELAKPLAEVFGGTVTIETEKACFKSNFTLNELEVQLSIPYQHIDHFYKSGAFELIIFPSCGAESLEITGLLENLQPDTNLEVEPRPYELPQHPLSTEQEEVYRAVYPDNARVLVKGYPGSGKSYLVREVINNTLSRGQKVLILGPTNLSVDSLLDSVGEDDIVRLGVASSVDSKYHSKMLIPREVGNSRSKLACSATSVKKALEAPLLASTIHTFYSSPIAGYYKADLVVIDEVGKLSWYVVNSIVKRYNRALLVGDPTQIKPLSGEKSIYEEGNLSTFSITTQYRMNMQLVDSFNKIFDYNLKCGMESKTTEIDSLYPNSLYFFEGDRDTVKELKMRYPGAMLLAPYNREADMIGGITIDKAQGLDCKIVIVYFIDKGGDHLNDERVCVALSRGKEKTFVVGNSNSLSNSKIKKLISLCKENNTYISQKVN